MTKITFSNLPSTEGYLELLPWESGKTWTVVKSFTIEFEGKRLTVETGFRHDRYSFAPNVADEKPAVAHDKAFEVQVWDDGSPITLSQANRMLYTLMKNSYDQDTREAAGLYFQILRVVSWVPWCFSKIKRLMKRKEMFVNIKSEFSYSSKDRSYWENKHPKVAQEYEGRLVPGTDKMYSIDVRHFVWNKDVELEKVLKFFKLKEASLDFTALNIQRYVVDVLKYTSDDTQFKTSECWLFPRETLELKKGDCEDGAILIASLLLTALPEEEQWRVRVAAGFVRSAPTAPQGGHGYCTYCRCTDNEWVALDWCYLEDSKISISKKILLKDKPEYEDVWFSFNHQYAWSHTDFSMRGRVRRQPVLKP